MLDGLYKTVKSYRRLAQETMAKLVDYHKGRQENTTEGIMLQVIDKTESKVARLRGMYNFLLQDKYSSLPPNAVIERCQCDEMAMTIRNVSSSGKWVINIHVNMGFFS